VTFAVAGTGRDLGKGADDLKLTPLIAERMEDPQALGQMLARRTVVAFEVIEAPACE